MRSFLPGRPQSSRQALCTVNWDGLRLVAYISGSTVIIFNGRRELLQSISVDEASSLHSLSIDEQSGQLAVSDGRIVYVYQPLGRDYGDLRWTRAHTLPSDDSPAIKCLSWGSPNELLVSGRRMTLWNFADDTKSETIWSSDLSSPVETALFSPDGSIIASCGLHDRIVKIWRRLSYEQDSTRFDIAYLSHPATVTDLSWRQFWHQEQSLDNLLYTYCADGNVRVWAQTDHHALWVLQKIVTLDTNASIQPRRMSVNSISKTRFSFILQSRDLARATERAIQTARNGTDHALEHLVEVANRSPEICVILDGLGHMSAWGIENVGSKGKAPPEKFNVALVDGVNITLPAQANPDTCVQIVAFANSDAAASLCILVHSFSGQIDWYQGSFVSFFDTSARKNRLDFQACWSGHDSVIDKMISSDNYRQFLSLTEDDQVIYWSQTENNTPVRICEMRFDSSIIDAEFVNETGHVAVLQDDCISLWELNAATAKLLGKCALSHENPLAVICSTIANASGQLCLTVVFEKNRLETFDIYPLDQADQPRNNGYHKPITSSRTAVLPVSVKDGSLCFGRPSVTDSYNTSRNLLIWSDSGDLEMCSVHCGDKVLSGKMRNCLKTHLATSNIAALLDETLCAMVHVDYCTISIWNIAQNSCEWTHKFTDFDHIQDLCWFSKKNGPALLAVQFAYYIVIISPQLYSENFQTPSWVVRQVVQTRPHSSHVIGALCWLEPNQIAVGVGNQIISFDISGMASPKHAPDASQKPVKAADSIQLRNSTLGLYTPECLGRLLAMGELQIVSAILGQMHEAVRFSTTGEEIQLDTSQFLANVGSYDQIPQSDADISDIKTGLNEYVTKISETQLKPGQKRDLQDVVDVAHELMQNVKSMDQFALTYLYYFLRAINETKSGDQDLRPLHHAAVVGASLSQTQESLLHYVLAVLEERKIKLTWSTARCLGIFLFIGDDEIVKLHFESVARAEYNRNPDDKNPVDCSLYYLALDKKAILQSLWRRTLGVKEKESTMKLLAHDFNESKWKATALKNAYALLSRRRFEYAAAFFLLGGSLADAVNVCVNQLQDFQLAIAITRVWTGGVPQKQRVLANLIDKVVPDLAARTHEARWMLVWGSFQTQDWSAIIRCLTQPVYQLLDKQLEGIYTDRKDEDSRLKVPVEAMYSIANDPTLLINVYFYARRKLYENRRWTADITNEGRESQFLLRSVQWYQRAGLDWLALRLVAGWIFLDVQATKITQPATNGTMGTVAETAEPNSLLDEWMMQDTPIPAQQNNKDRIQPEEEKPKPRPAPTQFVEPTADSLLDSFGF